MEELEKQKIDEKSWDENKLVSLSEAASKLGFTPEYLNLLCRQKRMKGKKLGRNWFTTKEWADEYFNENSREAKKERGVWVSVVKEEKQEAEALPLSESLKREDSRGENIRSAEAVTSSKKSEEPTLHQTDSQPASKMRMTLRICFNSFFAVAIFVAAAVAGNFYLQMLNGSNDLEKIYGTKILDQEGFVKGEETEEIPGTNVAFASENFQVSQINVGSDVDILDNDENTPLRMYDLDSEGFTTKDKKEFRMLVKWKTNKMTKSEIVFSKQNSQDEKILAEEDYGFDHVAVLTKLDFSNAYIYTIRSLDKWGNEIESDSFGFYTGSREVSVFEMIIEALNEVFGWAMKE